MRSPLEPEVTVEEPRRIVGSAVASRTTAWLGTAAVWLSAISTVIYFLMSHGIRNQMLFLLDRLAKAGF